jgi:hypothetical protein
LAGGSACPTWLVQFGTGIGGGGGGIGILESKIAERSQFGAGGARFARLIAALGFQALEFLQGAVVEALGGIDAALEAGEGVCAAAEGLACAVERGNVGANGVGFGCGAVLVCRSER